MLVIGTANRKKGIELEELLRPVGVEMRTLADFSDSFSVVEDGNSVSQRITLK